MDSKLIYIFVISIILIKNKSIDCLNASEIDSFVLLHDRVKNTLIEIAINGRCHSPKPTVVYVEETLDKLYLPRATILYRCSDQFACCPNPRHTCAAVHQNEVDIGFYTLTKSEDQITERSIEILKFKNHTKCSCRRRDELRITEPKEILLHSESSKRESHTNSTTTGTKTTKSIGFTSKSTEKKIVVKTETKTLSNTSFTQKTESQEKVNSVNSTLKQFTTDNTHNYSSVKTTPYSPPLEKRFYESSLVPKTYRKDTSISNKSTTASMITSMTTKPMSQSTTKMTRITTKPILQKTSTQTKHFKDLFINSTPKMIQSTTVSTVPMTKTVSKWIKPSIPFIKSTIDYSGLEREDDLKPEEDVIINNGHGINLFYTNSIFFRPLTTTPYRVFRFIQKNNKKCGQRHLEPIKAIDSKTISNE